MVATIELEIPAKRPCVPLPPLEAFADSPSALRLVAVPPPMGDWHVTAVRLSVAMPSGQAHGLAAVREANAWIVTIPACAVPGEVRGGWTVYADGVDENGAAFANLALGRGDVRVIPADGAIAPGEEVRFMHLVYERQDSPREGDVFQSADGWEIYKGGASIPLGGGGTTDYNDLDNKPAIGGVTLSGNKTAADLGLATSEEVGELAGEVIAKYTKPQEGIPATDLAQGVRTSLGKADTALQSAPVASVNGKTGAVVLTANDIGALSNQGGSIGDGMIRAGLPSDEDEYAELASDGLTVYYYSGGRWVVATYYGPFAVNIDGAILTLPKKNGTLALLSDIPSVAGLAPLASPAFTGTPTAPTPTQQSGDTQIATKKYVDDAVSGAMPNLDYVMRVDPETGGIYYTTPDANA